MSTNGFSFDAYAPAEMARRVESVGIKKASLDWKTMFGLAMLAGAFIGLGANFATLVWADNGLPYSLSRLAGGIVFTLGLILVIVGGAELFTGNALLVMAWAANKVSSAQLLRNWLIVYAGNFVGSVATAYAVYLSRQWAFDGYRVGAAALNVANAKVGIDFVPAVMLGVLCNALVCLAVWLCFSARSTTDKVLAIVPPISAFVAGGFEHSVANMYFVPLGLFVRDESRVLEAAGRSAEQLTNLTWQGFVLSNLLPVTIGNIVGGAVLGGAVYWLVYQRHEPHHRFVRLARLLGSQAMEAPGGPPADARTPAAPPADDLKSPPPAIFRGQG